jgi:hypothetical protein
VFTLAGDGRNLIDAVDEDENKNVRALLLPVQRELRGFRFRIFYLWVLYRIQEPGLMVYSLGFRV